MSHQPCVVDIMRQLGRVEALERKVKIAVRALRRLSNRPHLDWRDDLKEIAQSLESALR